MLRTDKGRLPVSVPDHRTLHGSATLRTGGWAVCLGVAAGWVTGRQTPDWTWTFVPLVGFFVLEDWRGTPAWTRLAVQLGCAFLFAALAAESATVPLWVGAKPLASALAIGIAVVGVVWMANLYNFMDGSDGLASLSTVIGFSALGLAAILHDDGSLVAVTMPVVAATLPFLFLNWSPARIFLGDAGAVAIGFLAGAAGADGIVRGVWPVWFPVLVFAPLAVDATVTLVRRGVQGYRVMEPHRDHCYQRLVQLGWGHARTAVAYGIAVAGCAGSGIVVLALAPEAGWATLGAWLALLGLVYLRVSQLWAARR
jgi:UDP-N-acetylmuramyl pentapeptide phosphotransferase/UDP-N-acetylglucosamine-1-phosphate transferase